MDKHYEPRYLKLADYWEQPWDALPKDLQNEVSDIFWEYGWDKETAEIRQGLVRQRDWNHDPTQEAETLYALFNYSHEEEDGLDESELISNIKAARRNIQSSVVLGLQDVADQLKEIVSKGDHWPNTEPLLWISLNRFSCEKLKAMRDKAIAESDYPLELALKDVAKKLEHILDIDRDRVGTVEVAAYEMEQSATTPVAVEKVENVRKVRTNKKKWHDAELKALLSESREPGVTQSILGIRHNVKPQRISVLLIQAKEIPRPRNLAPYSTAALLYEANKKLNR